MNAFTGAESRAGDSSPTDEGAPAPSRGRRSAAAEPVELCARSCVINAPGLLADLERHRVTARSDDDGNRRALVRPEIVGALLVEATNVRLTRRPEPRRCLRRSSHKNLVAHVASKEIERLLRGKGVARAVPAECLDGLESREEWAQVPSRSPTSQPSPPKQRVPSATPRRFQPAGRACLTAARAGRHQRDRREPKN